MKKKFYNEVIEFNKQIGARNKYYTNIICSCSLLNLISNMIISVIKIAL